MAQIATAPHTAVSSLPDYRLEVGVTWDATLSNATTNSKFWMQGGAVEAHARLCCGLSVVADLAGAHRITNNSSEEGLDMVTATFGPRYTWTPGRKRYGIFAQGLVGIVSGFNSVLPAAGGATSTQTGLAAKAGGGLNITLAPRIALRAFQANWLRTQLPNSTTNVQNSLTLGAGIVMRFR
jgi:hypothetical protein